MEKVGLEALRRCNALGTAVAISKFKMHFPSPNSLMDRPQAESLCMVVRPKNRLRVFG